MEKKNEKPAFVYTAEDICALERNEVPMLCDPIFPRTGLAALVGSSDGGKSYFSLCAGLAIASRAEQWLGLTMKVTHGSVLIVSSEDGVDDIKRRIELLEHNSNLDKTKLRFIFDTENVKLKIRQELERQPADLVILDTFGDLFTGELNNSIHVRRFLNDYKVIARDFNCLVLVCHHIGKGKENRQEVSKNDILGSQAIESTCRTVLMLKKMPDSTRGLTIVKGNHLTEELKKRGIGLNFDAVKGFTATERTIIPPTSTIRVSAETDLPKLIADLYIRHKSVRKVAEALKGLGVEIGKTRVSEILKISNLDADNYGGDNGNA